MEVQEVMAQHIVKQTKLYKLVATKILSLFLFPIAWGLYAWSVYLNVIYEGDIHGFSPTRTLYSPLESCVTLGSGILLGLLVFRFCPRYFAFITRTVGSGVVGMLIADSFFAASRASLFAFLAPVLAAIIGAFVLPVVYQFFFVERYPVDPAWAMPPK